MDRIAELPVDGPLQFPTVNTPADYDHDMLPNEPIPIVTVEVVPDDMYVFNYVYVQLVLCYRIV